MRDQSEVWIVDPDKGKHFSHHYSPAIELIRWKHLRGNQQKVGGINWQIRRRTRKDPRSAKIWGTPFSLVGLHDNESTEEEMSDIPNWDDRLANNPWNMDRIGFPTGTPLVLDTELLDRIRVGRSWEKMPSFGVGEAAARNETNLWRKDVARILNGYYGLSDKQKEEFWECSDTLVDKTSLLYGHLEIMPGNSAGLNIYQGGENAGGKNYEQGVVSSNEAVNLLLQGEALPVRDPDPKTSNPDHYQSILKDSDKLEEFTIGRYNNWINLELPDGETALVMAVLVRPEQKNTLINHSIARFNEILSRSELR